MAYKQKNSNMMACAEAEGLYCHARTKQTEQITNTNGQAMNKYKYK